MSFDEKLYHYTSVQGLIEILKSGKLIGHKYREHKNNFPYCCMTEYPEVGPDELCLVRRAGERVVVTAAKQNVDNIKILLKMDEIRKLRYIKKPYSICGCNGWRYLNAIYIINELCVRNGYSHEHGQNMLRIVRQLTARNKETIDKFENHPDEIRAYTSTFFKNKTEAQMYEIDWVMKMCVKFFYNKHCGLSRDAEERLDLSKNFIPVSSKYMKIILGKKILRFTPTEYYQYRRGRWKECLRLGWIDQEMYDEFERNFVNVVTEKEKVLDEANALVEEYKQKDPDLFEVVEVAKCYLRKRHDI